MKFILVLLTMYIHASSSFQLSPRYIASIALRRAMPLSTGVSSSMHLSPGVIYMDDEDDGEEGEEEESSAPDSGSTALTPDISIMKEGISFGSEVNGSDVRVGIIMAKWNADVIEGLYKVKFHFLELARYY